MGDFDKDDVAEDIRQFGRAIDWLTEGPCFGCGKIVSCSRLEGYGDIDLCWDCRRPDSSYIAEIGALKSKLAILDSAPPWLVVALERIAAGEPEREVMGD